MLFVECAAQRIYSAMKMEMLLNFSFVYTSFELLNKRRCKPSFSMYYTQT